MKRFGKRGGRRRNLLRQVFSSPANKNYLLFAFEVAVEVDRFVESIKKCDR